MAAASLSDEATIVQRLKANDPTLTFLIVRVPNTPCICDFPPDEIAKLDLPQLILRFITRDMKRETFLAALASRGISEPCLSESWLGGDFCEALAANSMVTCLALNQIYLKIDEVRRLRRAMEMNTTLQVLLVHWTIHGQWGIGLGEGLARNPALTSLTIFKTGIGDRGGKRIGEALKVNSTLTDLNLSWNKIGEAGGIKIGEALAVNSSLTRLDLSLNEIAEGAAMLRIGEGLAANSTLTELNLSNVKLRVGGTAKITAGFAVNSVLTKLDLSNNDLGDDGAVMIAEALAINFTIAELNSTLKVLNLQKNQVGDIGGGKIGEALAVNSALTVLDLSLNPFESPAELKLLQGLLRNPTLTRLEINRRRKQSYFVMDSQLLLNQHNGQRRSESLFYLLLPWLSITSSPISSVDPPLPL